MTDKPRSPFTVIDGGKYKESCSATSVTPEHQEKIYTHVELKIKEENNRRIKLEYNDVTKKLELGNGLMFGGKIYRIQGAGHAITADGSMYRTFNLSTVEKFANTARTANRERLLFEVMEVDEYVMSE